MSKISEYLKQIKDAVYGEEVRGSIINAITQCYEDATSNAPTSSSDLPETLAYLKPKNETVAQLEETATDQKMKTYCYPKSQVYTKDEVDTNTNSLNSKIDTNTNSLNSKIDTNTNSLNSKIDTKLDTSTYTTDTNSLKTDIDELYSSISSLNEAMGQCQSSISTLEDRVSTNTADIKSLSAQVNK